MPTRCPSSRKSRRQHCCRRWKVPGSDNRNDFEREKLSRRELEAQLSTGGNTVRLTATIRVNKAKARVTATLATGAPTRVWKWGGHPCARRWLMQPAGHVVAAVTGGVTAPNAGWGGGCSSPAPPGRGRPWTFAAPCVSYPSVFPSVASNDPPGHASRLPAASRNGRPRPHRPGHVDQNAAPSKAGCLCHRVDFPAAKGDAYKGDLCSCRAPHRMLALTN